jgi:hypothetical protein
MMKADWTPIMIRKTTKTELLALKYKGQHSSFDKVILSLMNGSKAKEPAPVVEEVVSNAPTESC